jgi:hypothetical protein
MDQEAAQVLAEDHVPPTNASPEEQKEFAEFKAMRDLVYSRAVEDGRLDPVASPAPFCMAGLKALGSRSPLCLLAIFSHWSIPVLAALQGMTWSRPALTSNEKPSYACHTIDDAMLAFAARTIPGRAIIINVRPLAMIVLSKTSVSEPTKMLFVETGAIHAKNVVKCEIRTQLLCPKGVSFTTKMRLTGEAVERGALVGLAIKAIDDLVSFDELVGLAREWQMTMGNLHNTLGQRPCDMVVMDSFQRAVSRASYLAFLLAYDRGVNKAVCKTLSLLDSNHSKALSCSKKSALFRLEASVSAGNRGSRSVKRYGKLSMVDLEPGRSSNWQQVLQMKRNMDMRFLVDCVLVYDGKSIMAPLPGNLPRMFGFTEMIRSVEDVRRDASFPVRWRQFVPKASLRPNEALDYLIYCNDVPMTNPQAGSLGYAYLPCFNRLPPGVRGHLDAMLTTPAGYKANDLFRAAAEENMDMTLTKAADANNRVVFTVSRDPHALYTEHPRLCPFTWAVYGTGEPKTIGEITGPFLVEADMVLTTRASIYVGWEEMIVTRWKRGSMEIHLKLSKENIIFTNCGTMGSLLAEKISVRHILELVLCAFVRYTVSKNNDAMLDEIDFGDLGLRVYVHENPFAGGVDTSTLNRIPAKLLIMARLRFVVSIDPFLFAPVSPERPFREHIQCDLANRMLRHITRHKVEDPCQHFSSYLANNDVMLCMNPTRLMQPLVDNIVAQLHALDLEEIGLMATGVRRYSLQCSTLLLDPDIVTLLEGIRAPTWVLTLLDLPYTHALRLIKTCYCTIETVHDANGTQVLFDAAVLQPALVRHVSCPVKPYHIYNEKLWHICDYNSFDGNVLNAMRTLQIGCSVVLEAETMFYVSYERIDDRVAIVHPTFDYATMDTTPLGLFDAVRDHFNDMACAARTRL